MLYTQQHLHELLRYKLYALVERIQLDSGIYNPRNKYYFNLPKDEVVSIYKNLGLNPLKIGQIFCKLTDRYSQILLLLTCVGILKSDDSIAKNAHFLLMVKAWNDIVDNYFVGGIDVALMDKVIVKKLSMKHLMKLHRTPFNVLANRLYNENAIYSAAST